MRGKLCVVTGATSGIGRATALALGAMGADMILLGRSETRGQAVVARIARFPQAGKVSFVRVDLSMPREVRDAARTVIGHQGPIDVLINNAGARFDHYQRSAGGHELTFATNHLGHFLLTSLLLERIMAASQGRIITVASGSHADAKTGGNWNPIAADYDRKQAYAKSKLANVLFAYELARRLTGTNSVSMVLDPGGVASNFYRKNGLIAWARHLLAHVRQWNLVSPREAARSAVRLAIAPGLAGANGTYYYRNQIARSSPESYDLEAARQLWALSLALTGLATDKTTPCLLTKP